MGTEYSRAGLLPAAEAAKVRALLKAYLDLRVSCHVTLWRLLPSVSRRLWSHSLLLA
jgi:hypothetical protein